MMTTKLYQIDTYLKEWDARILAAKPAADGDCLIQLDQTAFFPERGGQGADHGVIQVSSQGSQDVTFSVVDAQEDGDLIWHTVKPASSEKSLTNDLCTILSEGCKVHCILDWDRRFEHMQRHCGEHLLSGAFYRLFGGANHGFHMGQDYMTIDIALGG